MKILWLSNVPVSAVADKLSMGVPFGGWMDNMSRMLASSDDFHLLQLFPKWGQKTSIVGAVNEISYCSFMQRYRDPSKIDDTLEHDFMQIIKRFDPDVIHIWGSEYAHALVMLNACIKLDIVERVVVSIQGVCKSCAYLYGADLPARIQSRSTFRDLLRNDNIAQQQQRYFQRANNEEKLLKGVKHVIGRTNFDRVMVRSINSSLNYHHCNESLRDSFYSDKWDRKQCESYSIFVGQSNIPLKGLHYLLYAMPEIMQKYPDTKIYISGIDDVTGDSYKRKLRRGSYAKYLRELIDKSNLWENIVFLGPLNEVEVKKRMLKSHLVIIPSAIENSPNTLGEAMLLGVPSIASDTGGISDIAGSMQTVMLFPRADYSRLSECVCDLFVDDDLAMKLSQNAIVRANALHDREYNYHLLTQIYRQVGLGE
ncbi:glycosyltransferase family 4 protein [Eubacteriales bacterium OttesenSCG-928-M02]|nr:glycosyltransferase family 4 protein [Eubacteriales bacterium OttesenSCG-928-M02]